MSESKSMTKVTTADRLMLRALNVAPWLAFLLVALPVPLYFLLRRLTATEDAGVYALLFLATLAGGSIIGVIVALLLLFYRNNWKKRRRNQLAADGITAAELSWFVPELTTAERKALKGIEQQNPLLADAYRETLAARLTATRVLANARRELVKVENHRNRAALNTGTIGKEELQRELQSDNERLDAIRRAAQEHEAAVKLRLQAIEALNNRRQSEAETETALARLDAANSNVPLGLEAAKLEDELRRQSQRELRGLD